MVKILSSGEIVQDDDPRAQQRNNSNRGNASPRQGFVRHDEDDMQQRQYRQGGGGGSMFDNLNQRLLDMGVPRWNVMQYTVEPIVSAGFLLALLLAGFKGLLFAAALFFVSKWSQGGTGGQGQQPNRRTPGGGGGGGGHRLGR